MSNKEKEKATVGPARKIGETVGYVLPDGASPGDVRPAIIVRVWEEDKPDAMVNLQVFTDGLNDYVASHTGGSGILWATSVHNDEEGKAPGTYHTRA